MTFYRMKKEIRYVALFIVIVGCLLYTFIVQKNHDFSKHEWALVSKDHIFKTLPATKNVRKALEEHLSKCQKDLMEREESLRKEYAEVLERSKSDKPQDYEQARVIEEKRKVFQDSILNAQRAADDVRNNTRRAFDDIMNQIHEKCDAIIAQIAQENQLECVFDRNKAFYVAPGKDLTQVVFEMLAEQTKDILDWNKEKHEH